MKAWKAENKNRKAAFAGKFYPETKSALEKELTSLFAIAQQRDENTPPLQALISPHAAYVFSGKVAASAFQQIPEDAHYKRVFVLASSHQFHFKGASVYTQGNYETPLGEIEVDTDLGNTLNTSSEMFHNNSEAHSVEHSLEVQLPFLQYRLKHPFKLVPILLGTNRASDCKKLAKALRPYFVMENLFVISTDFSHYPCYSDANKLDRISAKSICQNNPEALLETLAKNRALAIPNTVTSLCGWTSVLTMLYLTKGNKYQLTQIDYQNSGDTKFYGDKKQVVGYCAIAVFRKDIPFVISQKERAEIIKIARQSITSYLKTGKKGNAPSPKSDGILQHKIGAFVSVYVKGNLRGCIGGFAQNKSLNILLHEMAISAVCDRRFPSVKQEELEDLTLEVSVLSPLKKIQSANEIELGRHGIFIRDGLNTGTFLPQVAKQANWGLGEFLGHCSHDKAGLDWEGWKTAELFTYEAIIVKE